MDVQTDIGQVVKMLAGDQPDDLADRALGIMAGQAMGCRNVSMAQPYCISQTGLTSTLAKRADGIFAAI